MIELGNHTVVADVVSGSRAYNTHTEESDVDRRIVYCANTTDFYLDTIQRQGKIGDGKDTVAYELGFFARKVLANSPTFIEIVSLSPALKGTFPLEFVLTQKYMEAVRGIFYSYKYSNTKQSRPKNAMHAVRQLLTVRDYLETGEYNVQVDEDRREMLLDIKAGISVEDYLARFTGLLVKTMKLGEKHLTPTQSPSTLRELAHTIAETRLSVRYKDSYE